jgi:hypothetical protein
MGRALAEDLGSPPAQAAPVQRKGS